MTIQLNGQHDVLCLHTVALLNAGGLGVHDVSRAMYDAVTGTDEVIFKPLAGSPCWSKVIATQPIEVKLFTFEPPAGTPDS